MKPLSSALRIVLFGNCFALLLALCSFGAKSTGAQEAGSPNTPSTDRGIRSNQVEHVIPSFDRSGSTDLSERSADRSTAMEALPGGQSRTVVFSRKVTSEAMGREVLKEAGLEPIAIEFYRGRGSAEVAFAPDDAVALAGTDLIASVFKTPLMGAASASSFVEQQRYPGWALDFLDRTSDSIYEYEFTGEGVHAYIVDSRVTKSPEFDDRIRVGIDSFLGDDDPYGCDDEVSHGAAVTGILAGEVSGTGRGAWVHNVAVGDCGDRYSSYRIARGLRWVENNIELPAVINLSMASLSKLDESDILVYEVVLERLMDRGAVVISAAGNRPTDSSCDRAPGRMPGMITSGGISSSRTVWSKSTVGPCLHSFAPATGVRFGGRTWNGTSFSSPLTAGLAAQVLEHFPDRSQSGVAAQLIADAEYEILDFESSERNAPEVAVRTHRKSDRAAPIIEARTFPTGNDRNRVVITIEPEGFSGRSFAVLLDGERRLQRTLYKNPSGQTMVRLNGVEPGRHTLEVEVGGVRMFHDRFETFEARESMEVVTASSCLAGNGRVDLNIINTASSDTRFRIEFEGLSPREYVVAPGDFWRMPFTGRPDGSYDITVSAPGFDDWKTVVRVDCDGRSYGGLSEEIQVVNACRGGNGFVSFQFVNQTSVSASYVIEFESTPNRSTSAAPHGQAIRAVSGRPDGVHLVKIKTPTRTAATFNVIVDCDNKVTTRDTVSAR